MTGFGSFVKKAAVAAVAYKIGDFLVDQFKAAGEAVIEQQKLLAQTNAVLKSTGGVANVTAKDVTKMSEALEKKSLIDAEVIQNGQNVLLTFTNIRNEAGKGNKIFDRSTQAAVDLSTALGTDLQSASTLVGKALNDPIKGVSALSKSGVQFTEQQKDMIKTLVESGDILGAQKIILGELDTQFAGSAEAASKTFGGALKRLKDTVDGVFESIIRVALPYLEKFANFLADNLPGAIAKASAWFKGLKDDLAPVITVVKDVFNSFTSGSGDAGSSLSKYAAMVKSVFNGVMSVVTSTVSIVKSLWALFGSDILSYLSGALSAIVKVVQGAVDVIAGLFKLVAAILTGDWSAAWDAIKQILSGAIQIVVGLVEALWSTIKFAFSTAKTAIVATMQGAWNAVVSAVQTGVSSAISFVAGLPGKAVDALGDLSGKLKEAGKQLIGGFIKGIENKIGDVKDTLTGITKKLTDWKGPESLDKIVLYNAGQLVIGGFINGLESQYGNVKKSLRGLTNQVAGTQVAAFGINGGGISAGGATIQHITVEVKVDASADPVEVGRKVAKVLKSYKDAGGRV